MSGKQEVDVRTFVGAVVLSQLIAMAVAIPLGHLVARTVLKAMGIDPKAQIR